MLAPSPKCRICASERIRHLGDVEYYSGWSWPIYDCDNCGCRFTNHQPSIYDHLHSTPSSIYGIYDELAQDAKPLFDKRDIRGLRALLSRAAKYRFVIEAADKLPKGSSLLEVGCSRGYLTAYFILCGHNALGIDISEKAIASAAADFGPHFGMTPPAGKTYDLICHTGTIACVSDPFAFTTDLLQRLAPGGALLFNAPLKEACFQRGQLWADFIPPPDAVTLYPSGIWGSWFGAIWPTDEYYEPASAEDNFSVWLSRVMRKRWTAPKPRPLDDSLSIYQSGRRRSFLERAITKVARSSRVMRFAPKRPNPMGYFVAMRRPITAPETALDRPSPPAY